MLAVNWSNYIVDQIIVAFGVSVLIALVCGICWAAGMKLPEPHRHHPARHHHFPAR